MTNLVAVEALRLARLGTLFGDVSFLSAAVAGTASSAAAARV